MTRILQTSDVHLDAKFNFLGERAKTHRQRIRETFRSIINMVNDEYDLLLIAGDLFDNPNPARDTIDFVKVELGKLNKPVCILPGNHDYYGSSSVYSVETFPDNVTVFSDTTQMKSFPELDLAITGNAITSKHETIEPLKGLKPNPDCKWNIGVVHGSYMPDTKRSFTREDLESSELDYIALGDWHGYKEYDIGSVKAVYSGAPEPTELAHGESGYVASIELDDGIRVEKRRVGSTLVKTHQVFITDKNQADITEEIRKLADSNAFVTIELNGFRHIDYYLNENMLEEELASEFYALQIKNSSLELKTEIDLDLPDQHAISIFHKIGQERLNAAQDEDEKLKIYRAIQIGYQLLQGENLTL